MVEHLKTILEKEETVYRENIAGSGDLTQKKLSPFGLICIFQEKLGESSARLTLTGSAVTTASSSPKRLSGADALPMMASRKRVQLGWLMASFKGTGRPGGKLLLRSTLLLFSGITVIIKKINRTLYQMFSCLREHCCWLSGSRQHTHNQDFVTVEHIA